MELNFKNIFEEIYNTLSHLIPQIISAFIVAIVFIIIGKLFHRFIGRRIQNKWKNSIVSKFISEATKWLFYIFGIIIALNMVGFGAVASGLIAGAGVSAIIFGFAFKDIGENFLAGIILAIKRPFEVNDIIEIEGFKGNVKGLDLRSTHLRNVEGKDIFIPNSSIIKNTLINYTRDGYLRINFMIGIAPENDIDTVRELIINYMDSNNLILKNPEPNAIVSDLGEFTTDIQVLFWVDILANKNLPDSYLGHNIRSKVITDIKKILDSNNIDMPSQVIEHKMYRDSKLDIKK